MSDNSDNEQSPMEKLASESGNNQEPELSREELEKAAAAGARVAEEMGKLYLAFGGRMAMELYGSLLNHMSEEAGRDLRVRLLEAIGPVCDERLELKDNNTGEASDGDGTATVIAYRIGLQGIRPGGAKPAHTRLMGQMSDVAKEIARIYDLDEKTVLEMSMKYNSAGGGASGESAVAMKYGEKGVAAVKYYEALRNKVGAMLLFGRRACHRLVLEEPELMEDIRSEANSAAAELGRPELSVEHLMEIAVEEETLSVAINELRDFERVGVVVERL